MRVDKQNIVSDGQTFGATAVSTDAIALGATGLDLASGEPIGFVFQCDTLAEVASGDETYEFQIVTATASNLTTNQEIIVAEAFTNAQAAAQLVAGARITLPVPLGKISSSATHIGARVAIAGTIATGVTLTIFAQPLSMVQDSRAPFRSGFTVAS